MTWFQTYSGKVFDYERPDPASVTLRDIAHALSMQCRFNGHCLRFYSVAEHSVYVSTICDAADARVGLMHDAAEAYVGDLVRPLKALVHDFAAVEARAWDAICKRFDLWREIPWSVKRADMAMLGCEKRELLLPPPKDWELTEPPAEVLIFGLGPINARDLFLARAKELGLEDAG